MSNVDEELSGRLLGLDETVDLAGLESFPASDAPAWSPTHAGGPWPPPPAEREPLHAVTQRVRDEAYFLADVFCEHGARGPRASSVRSRAADVIAARLEGAGLSVKRRPSAEEPRWIEAVLQGKTRPSECVVVAARLDLGARRERAGDTDETKTARAGRPVDLSGVATLLTLAHGLGGSRLLDRTVRLVAFLGDGAEPTSVTGIARRLFGKRRAASALYADELLRGGPHVTAMIALGALGLRGRERVPLRDRPRGRTRSIALIGHRRGRSLVARARSIFERVGGTGAKTATVRLPIFLPAARASDHRSFARRGVPSMLVTDALPARRPHATALRSSPSQPGALFDDDRVARACDAISAVVSDLACVG